MSWTGINQSHDWDETIGIARKYLDQDKDVMITLRWFENYQEGTEHSHPFEYEVYVLFDDDSRHDCPYIERCINAKQIGYCTRCIRGPDPRRKDNLLLIGEQEG